MANGTPLELKAKSDVAGAVLLCVFGVPAAAVTERLSRVAEARKTTIVKEESGKVWARVYPKEKKLDGLLARSVAQAAQAAEATGVALGDATRANLRSMGIVVADQEETV